MGAEEAMSMVVPAAVVFDLAPLGTFAARPTPDMAAAACDAATASGWAEGSVGVGTGCAVGKVAGPARAMKGGVGVAVAGAEVRADRERLRIVDVAGDVEELVPPRDRLRVVRLAALLERAAPLLRPEGSS